MKSHNYILLSALALTLAACTSEEDLAPGDKKGSDEIRFCANTEFTRVADITTNTLGSFFVYAYTGTGDNHNLFMNNVEVVKTSGNTWTYSPVQYWPASQTVDFYAYAPAGWVGSDGPLKPVAYDASSGTEDIIYAVSPGLKGAVGQANAQVIFNFRHALSKATVKISSTNSNLKVMVSNVVMSNIMTKGNFTFPCESTSDEPTATNVGTWADQNSPEVYVLHMSQSVDDRITLDTTPTVIAQEGAGRGGNIFVLPQPLTYRSNGFGKDNYIAVMCSIYDANSGTKLWPNENTPSENVVEGSTFGDGLLKFPLSSSKFSSWEPGCHYIYSLVINSNDEMGAIEFGTPTVDSYIDVETNYQ